jgi:hypothetical protein
MDKDPQVERTKRGAAGLARTTAGRSWIVGPNKKKYDRKKKAKE